MARKKRLTRKEKISQSAQEYLNREENPVKEFTQISPEDIGITDKDVIKKIIVYSEQDGWDEDFKHPKTYYINDALGNFIYFRTNSRLTAQNISDKIFGKGFYSVKKAIVAQVR